MRSQMPLGIGEFSDSGDLKKKKKQLKCLYIILELSFWMILHS